MNTPAPRREMDECVTLWRISQERRNQGTLHFHVGGVYRNVRCDDSLSSSQENQLKTTSHSGSSSMICSSSVLYSGRRLKNSIPACPSRTHRTAARSTRIRGSVGETLIHSWR